MILLSGSIDISKIEHYFNEPLTNKIVFELLIVVFLIILVNFIWDLLIDTLEHIFWKHQKHIIAMMHRLFKELTIVGIWAIILVVSTILFGVSENIQLLLEMIHLFLFCLVILYIVTALFIAIISLIIFWIWSKIEVADHAFVIEKYLKTEKQKNTWFYFFGLNPLWRLNRIRWTLGMAYVRIRHQFILSHELVPNFEFDRYLKRCVRHLFVDLSSIHWSVLAFVLILVTATWLAFFSITYENGVPLIILAFICLTFHAIFFWKCKNIYNEIERKGDLILRKKLRTKSVIVTENESVARQQFSKMDSSIFRHKQDERTIGKGFDHVSYTTEVQSQYISDDDPLEKRKKQKHHKKRGTRRRKKRKDADDGLEGEVYDEVPAEKRPSHNPISMLRKTLPSMIFPTPNTSRPVSPSLNAESTNSEVAAAQLQAPMMNAFSSTEDIEAGIEDSPDRELGANHRVNFAGTTELNSSHGLSASKSSRHIVGDQESEPEPKPEPKSEPKSEPTPLYRGLSKLARTLTSFHLHDHPSTPSVESNPEENPEEDRAISSEEEEEKSNDTPHKNAMHMLSSFNFWGYHLEDKQSQDQEANIKETEESGSTEEEGEEDESWYSWTTISDEESDDAILEDHGSHIKVRNIHHYHHHHHHHYSEPKKEPSRPDHHHQSDLVWITSCLFPMLCCRFDYRKLRKLFVYHSSKHKSLFWFNSPRFTLYWIKVWLFLQATIIGAIILCILEFLVISWYYLPIIIAISVVNVCFFIPTIVYFYSVAVSIGEFSKEQFIREVYLKKKIKKETRREALVGILRKNKNNLVKYTRNIKGENYTCNVSVVQPENVENVENVAENPESSLTIKVEETMPSSRSFILDNHYHHHHGDSIFPY